MVQPHWYYNLASGEPESPLGYLLQCLLESRVRLGHAATLPEEEEANVYLGHLLLAAMTPGYRDSCARYVAPSDSDIFQKIETVRKPAEKFFVYRANADYRLLSASVFRPVDAPVAGDEGSTYYHFAAEYNRQIYRRTTTLSTVLEHLSDGFHTYETILTHMRHAYFQLWAGVSDDALAEGLGSLEPPAATPGSPQ